MAKERLRRFTADQQKRFASNLKLLRVINGFEANELSAEINMSYTTVSRLEQAKYKLPSKTAIKIAEYFEVDLEDMITKKLLVTYEFK